MSFCQISSKHKEKWRFCAIATWKYVITIASKWKELIPLDIVVVQELGESPFKEILYVFHLCIILWVEGVRK